MCNGLEVGVVICSIYDDKNKPVVHEQDIKVERLLTAHKFLTTGKSTC